MIYGERIQQVRKIRRLTQKGLADLIDAKRLAVSHFETGASQPSTQIIEAISAATGFPTRFFERPPGPEVPLGSLAFRARASVKQADIAEAHGWTEIAYECAYELASRLDVPPASLPNLSAESPEKAAKIARSTFGLSPDRPIRNLIHTLEQFGLFILALPMQLKGRDAWSAWVGINPRHPVIIVPAGSLGGRLRFTIAHEVDHLIAPDLRGSTALAEAAADRFASEFLLPKAGISDDLNVPLTLVNVKQLARRWGVSPQFIVMRSVQLGKVSKRRGQQVFRQLAIAGFARREPPDATIRIEKPRLFKRFAELIYGVPVDPRRIATDFGLPPLVAAAIVAAHAERSELVATVADETPGNSRILRFPAK